MLSVLRSPALKLLLACIALCAGAVVFAPAAGAFGQLSVINPVGGGPDDQNYQLDGPSTVLRAPDGFFYVVDSSNSRIVKLSSDGRFVSAFGGPTSANSGTRTPISAAIAPNGGSYNIIVSTLIDGVKMFSSDGAYIAKIGSIYGYLAYDPTCGELLISEPQQRQVQRFAITDNPLTAGTTEHYGDLLETFGGGATSFGQEGKLWSPRGIDVDSTGRAIVGDAANFRASTYKPTGTCASRTFAYDKYMGNNSSGSAYLMPNPVGVTVDRATTPNRIYVTQAYLDNVVQAFTGDSNGEPFGVQNPPTSYYYPLAARWGITVPYGSNPGNGTDDLNYPASIAINGDNAWVAESGNDRIHGYTGLSSASFDPLGTNTVVPTTSTLWGRNPADDGLFESAGSMATAPDGSVWVTDNTKYRIQHFSAKGVFLGAFGEYGLGDPTKFQTVPRAVAVHPNGEVLVSDTGVSGIQRFSADGTYLGLVTWPVQGAGPIAPGAIDTDDAGDIFVWDYDAQKVLKVGSGGTILASFGSYGNGANDDTLYGANSIAVTGDGLTAYVLDQSNNRVKKFTSTDGVTYTFAAVSSQSFLSGSGDGQLSGPTAIALDRSGQTVAVADRQNQRIERFNTSDLSYASQFGSFGMGDGQLIDPSGVAFDKWGNLWVADTGNDRVERLGEAPTVAITSPAPSTTSLDSVSLVFSNTDPGADCDRVSGASVPLSAGLNTITVSCTNAQGTGSASVAVTRTAVENLPLIGPTLNLPKKLKLTKTKKFKFSVVCPDGCTVTPKLTIGRKSSSLKALRFAASPSARSVTVKLSKSSYKKAVSALKARKKVTLHVEVLSYKAKQGKSGSAIVKK